MAEISTLQSHARSTFLAFLFTTLLTNVNAQPQLSVTPVIETGLNQPIQFVNAGDGSNRVFIVQKEGAIRAYDASFNFLSTFLTVPDIATDGERGLLSMAFHPEYATNGLFFVYYVRTGGSLEVARFRVSTTDPNTADVTSRVILITIPHPTNTNHNGGQLNFGADGFLYLSTGDGGGGGDVANNAQNTSVLLGKILRFNVNGSTASTPYYSIPVGNPYGNEIFALGLRNPFRWSFDRLTDDMWIGDVGQDSYEEVNYAAAGSTAGVNYGWRCYEANNPYNTGGCGAASNYTGPVYNYPTPNPAGAVTGGVVYRGNAFPLMQGYYLSVDFYTGIYNKTISNGAGGWTTTTQTLTPTGIANFGETEAGELYVVSLTAGTVSRLNGGRVVPVTLAEFNGNLNNDGVALNWRSVTEQNLLRYDIEYSSTGSSFSYLVSVPAQNAATGYSYNYLDNANRNGVVFYRLKMIDADGSYKYSETIRINFNNNARNIIAPTLIQDGIIHLNLSSALYNSAELINMSGSVVMKKNIEGRTGDIKIPTGKVARGMYAVRLTGTSGTTIQKVIIE